MTDQLLPDDANGDTGLPFVLRVGQGFDVHPWSDDPERHLVLGGVVFDNHRGLAGHSDGDVAAHACTDAILGAAGAGDIGSLFPDSDQRFAGADSIALLAEAVGRVAASGWRVLNVDCTLICDSPRLAPRRDLMVSRLSDAVGAPVSIKGKRTEGVDGLAGGIQGHAVALLWRSAAPSDPIVAQGDA
jgi:2-C-methyl-D-erythritol 2,4-cyclodiphosphate synthase